MAQGRSVCQFGRKRNILTTFRWIAMRSGALIHDRQKIKPTDFDHPLFYHPYLWSTSQVVRLTYLGKYHYIYWMDWSQNAVQTFMVPRGGMIMTLVNI